MNLIAGINFVSVNVFVHIDSVEVSNKFCQ